MPLYETVLIARNDVTQQQVEAIADAIATQFDTDNAVEPGMSVKKREYWGLRSLAYRIKKNRKGHYMLLGLDAKPAPLNEMERQLRPERGCAALHDHPRRGDRGSAVRHPVAASPTTASAPSAGRSPPGASIAAAGAATTTARNFVRATRPSASASFRRESVEQE